LGFEPDAVHESGRGSRRVNIGVAYGDGKLKLNRKLLGEIRYHPRVLAKFIARRSFVSLQPVEKLSRSHHRAEIDAYISVPNLPRGEWHDLFVFHNLRRSL
jgi:hypothetical protein